MSPLKIGIKSPLIYWFFGSIIVAAVILIIGHLSKSQAQAMTIHRNLSYINGDNSDYHKLDLYLPAGNNKPMPVVVWIHGGAWMQGNKEICPASLFVKKGIAVASMNYRLSSEAPFPAQIQDCKSAVKYLRANAKQFNLNPNAIGAWGHSAGGHLAQLLGLSKTPKSFANDLADDSKGIQAVCNFAGPNNLFTLYHKHKNLNEQISMLFGNKVTDEALRQASPVTYVNNDAAPSLIVHGTKDNVVPFEQGKELYDGLAKAGAKVSLLRINGGEHNSIEEKHLEQIQQFFYDALN
jgi:acetyl esterase/lipase